MGGGYCVSKHLCDGSVVDANGPSIREDVGSNILLLSMVKESQHNLTVF